MAESVWNWQVIFWGLASNTYTSEIMMVPWESLLCNHKIEVKIVTNGCINISHTKLGILYTTKQNKNFLQKTICYLFLRKLLPISVQYSLFHMKTNTSKPLLGRQLISECPNIWQPLIVYKTQYDDMRRVFGRNQYKCQLHTLSTCYYCYLERKNHWYIPGIIFMLHIIKYNKIQV